MSARPDADPLVGRLHLVDAVAAGVVGVGSARLAGAGDGAHAAHRVVREALVERRVHAVGDRQHAIVEIATKTMLFVRSPLPGFKLETGPFAPLHCRSRP